MPFVTQKLKRSFFQIHLLKFLLNDDCTGFVKPLKIIYYSNSLLMGQTIRRILDSEKRCELRQHSNSDSNFDTSLTRTQCSPSGAVSGLCSAFGSGSGFYVCLKIWHFLHFLTADLIWAKLCKYVVLVNMDMCVTPFFDSDQNVLSITCQIFLL